MRRLSRQRVEGEDDANSPPKWPPPAASASFPAGSFSVAVAGAEKSLLTLLPKCALFVEEPAMVRNQIDRWWNKVEQRHERSGIGSLITPEDIYLRPEICRRSSIRTWASTSINSASSTCSTKTPPSAKSS